MHNSFSFFLLINGAVFVAIIVDVEVVFNGVVVINVIVVFVVVVDVSVASLD